MLEKVRSNARNAEFGALPLLIDDTERILLELKQLVELCMDYMPTKSTGKKVRDSVNFSSLYKGSVTQRILMAFSMSDKQCPTNSLSQGNATLFKDIEKV
jgi:hypothetical protein